MKRIALAGFALLGLVAGAAAQTPPPAVVNFATIADMPTLKDTSKQDHFAVTLSDAQVVTNLTVDCTAGRTELLIVRSDKACAIGGNGSIINPSNKQALPRTQYLGQYTVTADGSTDARTLSINYLAVGKVAPDTKQFAGSLNLKPELSSSGAAGLTQSVLKKITGDSSGPINSAVDTVDLNRLFIPSAGLPSDKGCTWSGNMVFAYQTYSWFMSLSADCGGKVYELKGNMPFTDTAGVEGQTQYDLTLTLPSTELVGDDALFATTDENADLFASVDGITGSIIMKNSNNVTVTVDGEKITTPMKVEASGSLTGTNVPLEVVRSFGTLIGILPSTFFGA
jgi:hypothetical protein